MNYRWMRIKHFVYKNIFHKRYPKSHENYDYYAATTKFMNEIMNENNLFKYPVLSVGGVTRHVVADLPMYSKIIHNTMIPMEEFEYLGDNIREIVGDFFQIPPDDELFSVKTCISHVTIHCMNDTRYGNQDGMRFRAYDFSDRLLEICPNIEHVIVSVPVSKKDFIIDNVVWLSDDKFIESFTSSGFTVEKSMYDKAANNNHYNQGERFSAELPRDYLKTVENVIGNYYFSRAD